MTLHLEVPPRPGSIGVYVGIQGQVFTQAVFICVEESREAMETRGEGPGDEGRPAQTLTRGRTLPLNSARLTAPIVARIAEGLQLPHSASLEETRQLIEGKLSGEREPRNVQVDLLDAAFGVTIRLRDASGIFLELESQDQASGEVASGSRDEDSRPEDAPDNNGGGVAGSRGASPRQRSPRERAGDEEGDIEHIPGAGEVTLEEEVVELARERVRLSGANRMLVSRTFPSISLGPSV